MITFFRDIPYSPFLVTGLIAGMLAGVACGLIGPYVITRRIVFLSGAIAHMAVGGIGAAVFARHHLRAFLLEGSAGPELTGVFEGRPLLHALDHLLPTLGAGAAALLGAVIIGLAQHRAKERIDMLIGAMWAVGMSLGVLLIRFTPGYHVELMSYLFGNLAIVSWDQIWFTLALDVLIVAAVLIFHKRLLALCLDEEQCLLQGVSVLGTNLVLLTLVALTVICLIQVVGLILVLALLTLPAATAGHYVQRLAPMRWAAVGLCLVLTTLPRVAVYDTPLSPESSIVLAAAAVYLVSVVGRRVWRGRR